MSFILDTHTFLWFVKDHSSLSATAKDIIEAEQRIIYLSAASFWEMAIKASLKKLAIPAPLQEFIETHSAANDFEILPITAEHAEKVAKLPFPASGHRDPFDRMIIAQAMCQELAIVSRDAAFDPYPIQRVW